MITSSPHYSVMLPEVLSALSLSGASRCLDGTLGAGGHTQAILQQSAPNGTVAAFELDPNAIAIASERLVPFAGRLKIYHASYASAADYLEPESLDGALLDLGVSSMQLDNAERGFSFLKDGPLDMRFDPDGGRSSAAELIASASEEELSEIFWKYGEERASRRIAAEIVRERKTSAFVTTTQLAECVARILPRNPKSGHHPATTVFQALRIAVNGELETVERALPRIAGLLKPGGRFVVLTFHSLEDRIVKNYFRRESADCLCPPKQLVCSCGHRASLKRVRTGTLRPGKSELSENVRSRSAKLRVAEKLPREGE